MLRIQRTFLDQVVTATTAADLHEMVQNAIRLEFSTIPPYLTAMLSLRLGRNREIWSMIHEVVIDEMLHMTIGCNILNALGGRPNLADPGFLPVYPGPLPMGIGQLNVSLEKFSLAQVRNVFMQIEEPESPIDIPLPDTLVGGAEAFSTIGAFYDALMFKFEELGDAAIVGDPARQVAPTEWFGDRVFPIRTASDAVRAIRLIVEEGEGTPHSPLDPLGDFAHYYKFWEIAELRKIKADPASPNGFSFSGEPVPFDPDGVWQITADQRLDDIDANSLAGRRASQFSFVFTKLMNALQASFDGRPAQFDAAMGLMFELKLVGQMLVQLPAVKNGVPTGLNAGPIFRYSRVPR